MTRALEPNVRDRIEYVFGNDGVLLKHPSAVEVKERTSHIEARVRHIDDQIARLQAEKARLQSDVLDPIHAAIKPAPEPMTERTSPEAGR